MRKYQGYTLIEVIIALAIFALIATITAHVMSESFRTQKKLAQEITPLHHLQTVTIIMRRDIQQAINRAARGDEMRLFPPFIGESEYTEFTHAGFIGTQKKQASIERVAYLCAKGRLIRRSWPHVDTPRRHHYTEKIWMKDLEKCAFKYISQNREILHAWRPYALSRKKNTTALPAAIEWSFTHKVLGQAKFIFLISKGAYDD